MNLRAEEYYARETSLPEIGPDGLRKLRSASVAIVGTGGVGSSVSSSLASMGVGHLTLIDQDIVEESNLHRLSGIGFEDLHLPKAESLARWLTSRYHWTKPEPIVETLTKANCGDLMGNVDLVIDGTDNFRTRYVLNRFSFKNGVPYLFTSAIANQGHLSLFKPPGTACLECLIPDEGVSPVESCETLGVTSTIVSLVGTLAANEATKLILGQRSKISGHLLTIDLAEPDFVFTRVEKDPSCAVCNGVKQEEGERGAVVMLCGDKVANVLPEAKMVVDFVSFASSLPEDSIVAKSNSVIVYDRPPHRVSVFKTGRLLIGNVPDGAAAVHVANEIWKELNC